MIYTRVSWDVRARYIKHLRQVVEGAGVQEVHELFRTHSMRSEKSLLADATLAATNVLEQTGRRISLPLRRQAGCFRLLAIMLQMAASIRYSALATRKRAHEAYERGWAMGEDVKAARQLECGLGRCQSMYPYYRPDRESTRLAAQSAKTAVTICPRHW